MTDGRNRVFPVGHAWSLDLRLRSWVQSPQRILGPYLAAGMTVLDQGCGPGYFTVAIARMVGASGRVIASDLQEGMLQALREKIRGTELERRVVLHRCEADRIGVTERVDFALAFYVVHELQDQGAFFRELASILRPGGRVLVVEPPFHVSRADFERTVRFAEEAGLVLGGRPRVLFSKVALLGKAGPEAAIRDAKAEEAGRSAS